MNIEIVKRSDFKSFFDMKTRWKDMDALGHINNATFLT
ncbi:MAG TPA: acyl-CoA thioesterase, partial [Candidatus Marinimicrobia bacterium]|nr:acyl-CoA thioesterase [Candidatus Neomarinimicrobiota bacterium]